jgi:hypothetical protein
MPADTRCCALSSRALTKAAAESVPESAPDLSVVESKNVEPVAAWKTSGAMTKAISILLIFAMLIQIIKPLGLPGLRRRMDFWKLALFAFAIWTAALLLREFS